MLLEAVCAFCANSCFFFWSRAFELTRIMVRAWEMVLKSLGSLGDHQGAPFFGSFRGPGYK